MINIAKILKDAPKGMKLYSPLFGEVFLYTILSDSKFITVRTADSITTFNEFGQWGDNSRLERYPDAECLLFPSKDCRTWEGWKVPAEPKFKVGDKIEATIYGIKRRVTIREVDKTNRCYFGTLEECIGFSEQDQWHLAPKPHYDISNFRAGMPVLVRADNNCRWDYSVFSRITGNEDWQFAVCNGVSVAQCIPFDGNEKLLGTTDMCSEEYVNW